MWNVTCSSRLDGSFARQSRQLSVGNYLFNNAAAVCEISTSLFPAPLTPTAPTISSSARIGKPPGIVTNDPAPRGQCNGKRMMIVAFVARGAFLARRKSRQSRALRLGLGDGDRVELGFFGARKSDQVATVIDHSDADMAIQRMRSVDGTVENLHQLLRCNRVPSFLLTLDAPCLTPRRRKKFQLWSTALVTFLQQ